MNVESVDHLNLGIPDERADEFVTLYRDELGLSLEHYDDYRDGEKGFFYLRLTERSVVHVSPRESFSQPNDEAFDHVALFVDEPQVQVRERLRESSAEIVAEVDDRLGATGRYPSTYFEDPSATPSN